jgi:Ca-activated chloride channel family protein
MRFAYPIFFLLAGYLPLLALRLFHPRWKSPVPTLQYPATDRVKRAIRLAGRPRSWLVPALRLAAIAALIVAAARPQLVGIDRQIEGEGIDIVVALDISGSMEAADFRPKNRLAVATEVLARFIDGRIGDRIGLVVFAGSSFTQCPLTVDHEFLKELLAQVDPRLSPQQGTAIGTGLANAVNRLRSSEAKSRIIVLLTDGRNNAGKIDPITAANMAKALGLRVYTIGVGKDRFPPMLVRDPFGQERYVRSDEPMDPDEDLLKQIASISGARFYRATDRDALQAILQEIDQLEKSKFEMRVYAHYEELMHWPLLLGAALLLVQLWLSHGRFHQLP